MAGNIPSSAFLDVTSPLFGADPTGQIDSTAAIQSALDAAGGVTTALCDRMVCSERVTMDYERWEFQLDEQSTTGLVQAPPRTEWPLVHAPLDDEAESPELAGEVAPALSPNAVFMPPGTYLVNGPLLVPPYVILQGSWSYPPECGSDFPSPNQDQVNQNWWLSEVYSARVHGTVIITDYGRGYEDRLDMYAFITLLGPSSSVSGVWIYYPWQGVRNKRLPRQSFGVVPYQWTIRAAPSNPTGVEGCFSLGRSESCSVSNVFLQNSYSGIDFSFYSGRHVLERIWGQPLREGIRIDACYDTGRIMDVHFWPFWEHNADRAASNPEVRTYVRDFIARHGFALVLFKSDMQIVHDFFAFGYFVGVHLGFQTRFDDPVRPGGACTGQFSNLNLDQCINAIDFHATDKSGIQISNANLVCKELKVAGELPRFAIVGHDYGDRPRPRGFLSVRGASMFGSTRQSIVSWQTDDTLMLSSCWLWNEVEEQDRAVSPDHRPTPLTAPIIDVNRGQAIIQGNWFRNDQTDVASVRVGADARAVVVANMAQAGMFPPSTEPVESAHNIVNR